jgi:hypothetical protein
MSSVHVFGTAELSKYDPSTSTSEAALIASLFLLFDHVELVGADEMPGPRDVDAYWEHVLTAYDDQRRAEIMANRILEGVPLRDYLGLWIFRDLLFVLEMHKNYKSLIDAGLLSFRPWRPSAEQVSVEQVQDFIARYRTDAVQAAVTLNKLPLGRRIGITASVMQMIREVLESQSVHLNEISFKELPKRFQSTSRDDIQFCLAFGAVFELIVRSRIAALSASPTLFLDESELALITDAVSAWGKQTASPPHERAQLNILTEALVALPCIVPRSLEALIEVREDLATELSDLRHHLQRVATDLAYAEKLTAHQIRQAVDVEVLRPLRDLQRRLRHPTRRLATNLLTGGPFVGATLAYIASQAIGDASLSSFVAAVAALAVAAAKTESDRVETINQSPVAFLLKASERRRT